MFKVNRQTGYALMMLAYLDRQRRLVPLAKLADDINIPRQFAAKIASRLAKAGILKSKEGKNGGYRLAQEPNQIKLLTLVEIFEGKIKAVKCQDENYPCKWKNYCHHKNFFTGKFINLVTKQMGKWSLNDIFNA